MLAISGNVAEEAMNNAGLENFKNKVTNDVTNPIVKEAPVNGMQKFYTDINFYLYRKTTAISAEAKLVSAFNSVGASLMYKPDFGDIKPTMLLLVPMRKQKPQ